MSDKEHQKQAAPNLRPAQTCASCEHRHLSYDYDCGFIVSCPKYDFWTVGNPEDLLVCDDYKPALDNTGESGL